MLNATNPMLITLSKSNFWFNYFIILACNILNWVQTQGCKSFILRGYPPLEGSKT